jgi:hypothetical protein
MRKEREGVAAKFFKENNVEGSQFAEACKAVKITPTKRQAAK